LHASWQTWSDFRHFHSRRERLSMLLMSPRRLVASLLFLGLMATPLQAFAAKYVVYFYGRSQQSWPATAVMGHDSTWTDVIPGYTVTDYDGNARLTDPTARAKVRSLVSTYCSGGNTCVLAAYSAGTNRMMLAIDDLKAAGTPATGILWIETAGSALGGTKLADISTNGGVRLLSKLLVSGIPAGEPIDLDLGVSTCRGTYGYLQNDAPVAMYQNAGSANMCNRISIKGWINVGQELSGADLVSDTVNWAVSIGGGLFNLFQPTSVLLCGNSEFPGGYGDGTVPVNSAAGYSDTGAHANHCDSGCPGNKYVFRAYEQVPLFPDSHTNIVAALVSEGSIRLAVPKTATCAAAVDGALTGTAASIVYQDADGPVAIESQPTYLLDMCGSDVWDGLTSNQYSTCLPNPPVAGQTGCCSSNSSGLTGGCSCGEQLCIQGQYSARSWFTGATCSGTEYTENQAWTWDGNGMVGEAGLCRATTHVTTYNGGCPTYRDTSYSLPGAHKVYRTNIPGYTADPNGWNDDPGYVVSSTNLREFCP
jgi:hypothetical protein